MNAPIANPDVMAAVSGAHGSAPAVGKYDKQRRYRQRRINSGKCPHCGKQCAPHYECDERRAYKQLLGFKNGNRFAMTSLDALPKTEGDFYEYIAGTSLSPLDILMAKEDLEQNVRVSDSRHNDHET